MEKKLNKNDLLRLFCVLLLFPCRFGAVSKRFQRVSVSSFSSLYIIPQGRQLKWQSSADRLKENSRKFTPKAPMEKTCQIYELKFPLGGRFPLMKGSNG